MESFTLANGMKVVLKERKDLNSITTTLWAKCGAAYEGEEERGLAHFLEHVAFNESQELPPGELDRRVESLGGELNAATSYDYTYYYITLPKGNEEEALRLLAQLVLHPKITPEAVEKEIPIVLEEIARSKDNPHELFAERFLRELYREVPYRHPILGYEESVRSFTAEKVKSFYRKFYSPSRLTLVVVGNFDRKAVEKVLAKEFETVKGEKTEVKEPEREKSPNEKREFTVSHPAVALPVVSLGWKLPPCGRHDVYFELTDTLLSSGKSSLLYQRLRERGIAYSASSNYQNLKFGSNFTLTATTHKVEEAREELLKSLQEALNPTEEEFLFAKEKLRKGELFGRESGEAEAEALGFALTVTEDEGYFTEFFEDLERATLKEFKEWVAGLKEEFLTGTLLPQTG
jgi:predicted Zn-dependent peptidase